MEEEFQFLLCERCQKEAKSPKLLVCLHTLCTECLEESKPIGRCPICKISIQHAGRAPFLDNQLFATLQAKLNTYQKIASNSNLICDRCKGGAEFWCSECEELLCQKCHDAHQWYLKQKSHESQRLTDLKNETAQNFLEGTRKSSNLFCSEPSHSNQVVSIYCRGCRKPLCCSCALLDGEHYNDRLYCDIRVEIESRKEELRKIKEELAEKKQAYEKFHCSVHERLQKLDKVRSETRDLIQEKVKEMVQWVQQKGDELLEKVDQQLHQEREDVTKKLQCTEHFVKRMESGERLVEKMNLFASDQEVMDMHPFIKESLDELQKEKLPTMDFRVQAENFAEVKGELQALFRRVKGERDAQTAAAPVVNSEVLQDEKRQPRPQGTHMLTPTYTLSLGKTPRGFAASIASPAKRLRAQAEKSIQASPKVMKLEDHDCEAGGTSRQDIQEVRMSPGLRPARASTPEREPRGAVHAVEVPANSPPETGESEVASIVISSSEDTEDDLM